MDAQYVKETVAPAIVEGLTAVVRSQPQDPVDFLGRFLVSYADHLEGIQKVSFVLIESINIIYIFFIEYLYCSYIY